MKNFLFGLLLVCLTLCLLVSCGQGEAPDTDTGTGEPTDSGNEENTTQSAEEEDLFPILKDGKAITIVYPLNDMDAMSTAKSIAGKIKELSGVEPKVKDDWIAFDKEQDSQSYEILVGSVNYPEYQEANAQAKYGDTLITRVGNKLCIFSMLGNSNLNYAFVKLAAQMAMVYDKDNQTILLDGSYHQIVDEKKILQAVPRFADKEPDSCDVCTAAAYQLYFDDVHEEDVQEYYKKVEAAGYTLYTTDSETEKGKNSNQFSTYIDDEYVLTLMHLRPEKEFRIVVESRTQTALAGLPEDNVYTKGVCDTTLTQIGLLYKKGDFNGQSHVMRLEDGSFLIVDGGFDREDVADRLYQVLQEQAPDPDNIVIAAWFFTHSHGDHCGLFKHFAKKYNTKVTVERFIYNLPVVSQCTEEEIGTPSDNMVIENHVGKFEGAEVVRARPGQIYYIRNATVRMLYTADLYLPAIIDYGNSASLTFQIEAEGMKTLILGDIGLHVAKVMMKIYDADEFQSEIIQVAHHGIGWSPNNEENFYPMVDPTYVLWPCGTGPLTGWESGEGYIEDNIYFVNQYYNKFFFESEKCKDNIYIAQDDVVILTLKDGAVTKIEVFENVPEYIK